MTDSYQPPEIKSAPFKEHLYFVNQLNSMNSTGMNRLLFYLELRYFQLVKMQIDMTKKVRQLQWKIMEQGKI